MSRKRKRISAAATGGTFRAAPPEGPAEPRLIYRNTRFLRVRFLQLVFWAPTLFFLWLAWATRIDDPTNNHLASLVLAPICALFALGIEVYLRLYVSEIQQTGDQVRIETLTTFGRIHRDYATADIRLIGEKRANPLIWAGTTGFWLDNSWSGIRVPDRRWPLILDTTAERPQT